MVTHLVSSFLVLAANSLANANANANELQFQLC